MKTKLKDMFMFVIDIILCDQLICMLTILISPLILERPIFVCIANIVTAVTVLVASYDIVIDHRITMIVALLASIPLLSTIVIHLFMGIGYTALPVYGIIIGISVIAACIGIRWCRGFEQRF